ncbi:recombinase family protein [Leucobacter sp. cx-169]|uniref:recombinase family protein n=1 Tax=Leucobacter sp. cx-169 TaxID=2770549 RepID=UPI00165E91B6|nr:recombinase family protein [Leucobacter sp. cx-169]MBC9927404.1 recombinase family protein [Leucobacter sp. cx-169]
MNAHRVGYARVSTQDQDLTAQTEGLQALGVPRELIFTDHGLTGRNRDRPGLERALAAVRAGDTFTVTKLDRLARSIPDARDIANELVAKNVTLSIGGSVYDPTDPVGKLLFNVLAMVAEFESDIIRARTREGMAIAKAKGRLKGRKSSVSESKRKHLIELVNAGKHTKVEIAEIVGISRPTLYRELDRYRIAQEAAEVPAQSPTGP